jgi:acetoin utilization deacetylase AcuC-like enzyme
MVPSHHPDREPSKGQHYQSLPCRVARQIRRGWRQLKRRWSSCRARFIYHHDYDHQLPRTPLDPQRAERILAFLTEEGLVEEEDLSLPRPPSLRNLLRAHTAEYLESIEQREAVERIIGGPASDEELVKLLDTQRLMVGGTIQATRLALRYRSVVVNLGGGFHHALRSSGMAFCVFNDIAVAITRLRARGFKEPILVIDLDLHDGNGTRAIFADDPTVYTYSIHNQHWGPTEAVAATSIALGDDVGDEVYLGTLLKTLPDVVETFQPGLVIYLAGTDPAADDPIGNWRISAEGLLSRDRFVIRELQHRLGRVPIVTLLSGGYGHHTWQYSARFFSWLLAGRAINPPDNAELTLMRFRRLKARLDPATLTSEPGDFSLDLSDEDLIGIVPGLSRRTRFLQYFSRHGVELLLERFGILDGIRVKGFTHPQIDLDLNHSLGETLRIYGDASRSQLLMELRVNRSQRAVTGCEVLVVEWLLLQNPRAEFGPYRRPLPGQKHPGLGLLKEVFGWLVMICEMLELDGVYYTPSSYHVAGQSRRLTRFQHPEHEARFRALETVLGHLSLAVASKALEEGRVIDESTGEPLAWEGFPMMVAATDRLRDLVTSDQYEQRVAAELAGLRLRLMNGEEPSGAALEEGVSRGGSAHTPVAQR